MCPTDVPKSKVYLKIPYISPNTHKLINLLKPKLRRTFPAVQFVVIPIYSLKIPNFFRLKDEISHGLRSSDIYMYTCTECNTLYRSNRRTAWFEDFKTQSKFSFGFTRTIFHPLTQQWRWTTISKFSRRNFEFWKWHFE